MLRAMPTAARSTATNSSDRALLDLCARLVREPTRVIEPNRQAVVGLGISIAEHRHRDLLQMDIALRCAGAWMVAGEKVAPVGTTTLVCYPGTEHGYALTPGRADSEVLNVKLRVAASWPAIRQRIFPVVTRRLTGEEPLVLAFRRLARLGAVAGSTSPLLVAALIDVLCLWPRETDMSAGSTGKRACGDQRVDDAIAIIDEHLDQPPSLSELARRTGLSPRHLVRRFAALCGCSPHEYITARRLGRARELLAQGSMNVTQASAALGFPSIHTFSRWFRRETGLTPAQYREHPSGF